ncbi:MAG: hypothetical protein Q7T16_05830 [Candidatus Burarchaeum sp.]|nr:metallophosphoesterase [Candidatus Burarchaeum sp.]MDO8340146.1 hypothetical protein [Candidatus Burarchaeum sp.]
MKRPSPAAQQSARPRQSGRLRFVANEAALLVGESLVIAELHIGYEQKLFPQTDMFFTDKLIARVRALLHQTGAKQLIVNGDVKDSVTGVTPEEGRELSKFFEGIGVPAAIVKGNHDGGIERHVHDACIEQQGGLRVGTVAIFHGNSWPAEELLKGAKTLVVAHMHPCVELGGKRQACWLAGKLSEKAKGKVPNWRSLNVIVMPAFSQLVGCMAVNGKKMAGLRSGGPLLRHEMFKLDEAQVYLLDGTCVGSVKDLRF